MKLVQDMLQGHRLSLARLITKVENRDSDLAEIMTQIYSKTGQRSIAVDVMPGCTVDIDNLIRSSTGARDRGCDRNECAQGGTCTKRVQSWRTACMTHPVLIQSGRCSPHDAASPNAFAKEPTTHVLSDSRFEIEIQIQIAL